MEIYEPREDSYLLVETLENYLKKIKDKKIRILDVGSGSGIQAEKCRELGFENIVVSDVNKKAVRFLRKKGFSAIKSNLFSEIREKFDLIIFNPPYLPEDKREPEDLRVQTTAGKEGYEIILRFLKEAKKHLKTNGKILLLFSTLSKPEIIKKEAGKDYKLMLLNRKKLFFEEIFVYLLSLN